MSSPPPDPDSPFASFAAPKKSALEQYRERAAQESRSSKERWWFLGTVVAGTVFGAVAAVAIGVDIAPLVLLLAQAYALGAALAGVLAGWLLAAVSWAVLRNRMLGGVVGMAMSSSQVEESTVRGNRWDRLSVWLMAWAALGNVLGAAVGAMLATQPATQEAGEAALAWTMGGATIGLVLAVTGWLVSRRRKALSADTEQS